RGNAFPSALEGALKIKEVSYIHAEGFAGAELKHGTIALIEKGVPVIVFMARDSEKQTASNAMEVKARGAFLIGIGEKKSEIFDEFFEMPECGEAEPILRIIPVQLLAYYLALERRLDPDKPRNLAKSVTVK
ncbi:MAG: SIS domain-containing protein, partial [Candidatus Diapherotrites archaeon]|nr:SIS domain-containing protein [Candidatus Diapherotrites archaeon]